MKKLYPLLRPLLFAVPPETIHRIALNLLNLKEKFLDGYPSWVLQKPIQVSGLSFPNPVGLAAGFDNNADYLSALFHLGFGFIEVGGVTPTAQAGNPKPRLFRLKPEQSLLNRKDFCNRGVDYLAANLKNRPKDRIVGVNIAKGSQTPLSNALADYLYCFNAVAPVCDYVTVNISCPNTVGLRQLQHGDYCRQLLAGLKEAQHKAADRGHYVPLWVKISPDLNEEEIKILAAVFCELSIEGIIATNTSTHRENVSVRWQNEKGGISGQALKARADKVLASFYREVGEAIPLIGLGGIFSLEDAKRKQQHGAKLVQVYTGLIYEGPSLVKELVMGW